MKPALFLLLKQNQNLPQTLQTVRQTKNLAFIIIRIVWQIVRTIIYEIAIVLIKSEINCTAVSLGGGKGRGRGGVGGLQDNLEADLK